MKAYLIQLFDSSSIKSAKVLINNNGIQLRNINNVDFTLFFIFEAPGYNKTYFDHISEQMDTILMESNIKAVDILSLEESILSYAKLNPVLNEEDIVFEYQQIS